MLRFLGWQIRHHFYPRPDTTSNIRPDTGHPAKIWANIECAVQYSTGYRIFGSIKPDTGKKLDIVYPFIRNRFFLHMPYFLVSFLLMENNALIFPRRIFLPIISVKSNFTGMLFGNIRLQNRQSGSESH